jgi:microcystin degradation protein MlrC
MGFRLAIGGISHETNTFALPTALEDFRIDAGEEIVAANAGVRSYTGGMLDAARRHGATVVPLIEASATPSGTIAASAFATMLDRLIAALRAAMPVDAVALQLHGAGVAEGCDDIETATLQAVRRTVGPEVPVVATLDLHGNLAPEMLPPATALFGVHLYPHTDSYERGVEAVDCIARTLAGEIRPVMALEVLPLLTPTSTSDLDPVRAINERCWEWEKRPGLLDVAFFHGFAHTDILMAGASVLAVADGDAELARTAARDVARHVWERRAEFDPRYPDGPEAVRLAIAAARELGGPIVINDTSDNPGGGTPGDGTHLLRALLAARPERTAFGFVWDPETAAQAHAAGVGGTIQVRLGGKTYAMHGEPIEALAYVKCLTDGRFVLQTPMGRGRQTDLGRMARLVLHAQPSPSMATEGVDVLVSSVRSQVLDPEVFLLHGIDVARCDIVALKSSNHFRAGFSGVAKQIVTADTPGLTSCNLHSYPYRRVRRPIAPLDPEARYGG